MEYNEQPATSHAYAPTCEYDVTTSAGIMMHCPSEDDAMNAAHYDAVPETSAEC